MSTDSSWWQKGTIYQIYPLSFKDSNGDGYGDLPGITGALEYCRWLGVDAVWLSPIYPSPMIDFGYDVADYTGIDPLFGTLGDFDDLVREAQRLDLKVLLDFVPNHSSDRHPWFVQSRSSRHNRYRDWYIWRDPAAGGGPPNNWLGAFGGSAWQWDEETSQYYLHSYLKEQPDLNWRNPEVEAAMHDAIRFWFNREVNGFRVDSISRLIKDAQFRDNPVNPTWDPADGPYYRYLPIHSEDQPETAGVIRRMRRVFDDYRDRVMIGEAYLSLQRTVAYHSAGVHLPFNFSLLRIHWDAPAVHHLVQSYEELLAADQWPNWVLGNHDRHRVASRLGRPQARVAAMLLLTLRGTPTLYYGDELAMEDVALAPERVKDPWEINVPGLGLGRDPERSPMQWSEERNAGFTSGTPWLAVAPDYRVYNVRTQRLRETSSLALYRKLIRLRAENPALQSGAYGQLCCSDSVLAYSRHAAGECFWAVLNFSPKTQTFTNARLRGAISLSTELDRSGDTVEGKLALRADEGVIVRCSSS